MWSTGLHLEIDPRGGEMSIYEKEEGAKPVYMCISTCTLGGSGGMLPSVLDCLRLLLVHSQELCIEYRIFNLEAIVAIHCRLAISKGGRVPPPPPLNEPLVNVL